ncbi:hypothetical protein NLJ89_g9376 [Agrocybe chaxingu]|uniref:VanZ-like domain-containing protein n=1 Tax=Agrocybe chaxingu TaxID=84603 RepID=A0A9W8JSU8_9AGAR|nr:hypothetical protein NLJ89_g9376 [Agrocybe chaxingu]
MWALLAYFVLWAEPRAYAAATGTEPPFDFGKRWREEGWRGLGEGLGRVWSRWAQLGRGSKGIEGVVGRFGVQVVPFFWAFTTLQIILHSLRIFSGFDAVQPPALLALALPHLPPPFPSLIVNALKYAQMGGAFLDDLAGLVVGVGFVVYFSGWVGRGEGGSWIEGAGF